MRVLVIDDSRAMRAILGGMLRQAGFEVAEAANGREGLERLGQLDGVDLALVDLNMPEMDGFQFVRSVRAEGKHVGLRLVMVTSETETAQVVRALEAGADEYVMKPFTRDVILGKLEALGIAPG